MLNSILSFFDDIRKGKKSQPDVRNDGIVLKIVANNQTVAYLSSEESGKVFTLVYTENFFNSGIPPFNLKPNERPEAGKIYRSDILWYPFAARVPNPSRPDFQIEMKKAALNGGEPVLEVLGKLSKTSISRSWTIHFDQAA